VSALPDRSALVVPLARVAAVSTYRRARPDPQSRYVHLLQLADALVAVVAGAVAFVVWFGAEGRLPRFPLLVSLTFPLAWPALVAVMRAYEPRFLQVGSEEFRRIIEAGVALSLALALVSYSLQVELARGYLLMLVLSATTGTLGSRFLLRKRLHHQRAAGTGWVRRTVVAGHGEAVAGVVRELRRTRWHGYEVVGVCLEGQARADGFDVPVTTGFDRVVDAVEDAAADAVIVLPCPHLDSGAVRRLGWQLERTGTQLLVAPGLLDVVRQRTTICLVGGMPLVHIAHAELRGARRLAKEILDRTVAALALVAVAPLLLVAVLAIRLDSPGPAIFRQERVGRGDRRFVLLKLRTMTVDAERRRDALASRNDCDGVLFKLHEDPRVTRVGRWLRRYSIDELPQLVNVLLGHMSLVGPRPPLATEVENYPPDLYRRLVVKPGLTGLWQVSGRSDLPWDEAVRLDLHYVENWSLMLDMSILWKTGRAVLSRAGAY
jgi:exopolysaccharide biosynthesis polyprenyl glycosylphosphotransferase